MRYRIGDIVELRSDLYDRERYDGLMWVDGMRRGCIVMITGETAVDYFVDGGTRFYYNDRMILRLVQRLGFAPFAIY